MKRSIYPEIDDDYDPKAENDDTVQNYHRKNDHISMLLMSAQFLFPLLAMVWSYLIVSYCLFSNPHRYIDILPNNPADKYKIQILISNQTSKIKIVGTFSPANILLIGLNQADEPNVKISISGSVNPTDVNFCIHSRNESINRVAAVELINIDDTKIKTGNEVNVGTENVKILIGGRIDPANVKISLSGDFSPVGVLIGGSINPDNVQIYGSNRSQKK